MKVTDLLKRDTVIVNLKSNSKDAVIDELASKLNKAGRLNDLQGFKDAIHAREAQSTTGIGEGIAIPHAKTAAVKTPAICFGKSASGVDYESLDGQPAHLFFMIAASEGANNAHLETLSKLSSLLMDAEFRKELLAANTAEEIIALFEAKEGVEVVEEKIDTSSDEALVLAVTACPTGIAHTYMAADALKAKAKEMGVAIKVETNGSTGVKNELTQEEIDKATAIIVAADKKVETNRFKGKHVIEVPVAAGIRQSEELINRALKQDAPIYKGDGGTSSSESTGSERKGIYKHLMNGISNMLPFVVGGGILIAISFFWGINAVDPNDPSYSVLAAAFKQAGDAAFAFLVPVLAGFIASSIGDRPAFMPGMAAGFLANVAGGGFLGGLVGGFLAGYVVVYLGKALKNTPRQLDGIKAVLLLPVLGLFVTAFLMIFVVNTPISALNEMISNWLSSLSGANAILLGAILGGMMAVDMGGPINKAAFAFGIAAIEAGNFSPHAAVMAGGMVPPLAIALATTFFKNKFTDVERESGITNYVMGASFITEGAIPFAAADPLRVIVSSVIGAATAGALALGFGVTLPAPHGGIFVIPLVNHPLKYILAILIGSIISAVILGFWKKPVEKR